MTDSVEFYYDFGSPTAYLAWAKLPEICARHGAALIHKPMLLGGVFKATGNATPAAVKPKGKWLFDDIERHAAHYGIAYKMNPFFIVNTLTAMRGAMWASNNNCLEAYNEALYRATWAEAKDTSDADVLSETLSNAGLDGEAMLTAVTEDNIKKQLIDATTEAVDRGVFGAPTMFVGDTMHFGQDRLDWVERQLAGS